MGFLSRFKSMISPATYFGSSFRVMGGFGSEQPKPRPFNQEKAVKQFQHWAYAATLLNANAVANVPLRLYTQARPGMKRLYNTRPIPAAKRAAILRHASVSAQQKVAAFAGDLQEVTEPHPAITVLQKVNGWQNGYELTTLRMIDLQATGNTYLAVVNGGLGVPFELWRMPPQFTKIVPSKTSFIAAYEYGHAQQDAKLFDPSEVIHFKMPNPADLFYGKGWYEAAWTALGLHESKRTMDTAKFDNMARPDFLVAAKMPMQKDAFDKFESDMKKAHKGAKNAGNFLSVNGDVSVTPLNFNVEEIGTATRVIEEIAACSGVPVAILLSNDPNRSGSETARVSWYRNTVKPYCKLDEEKLNEKYLPRFAGAEDLVLMYDLVSFEDEQAQAKRLSGLVAGGILKPNEARTEMGYDALADAEANRLYPPAGNTGDAAALQGDANAQQNQDRNN